MLNVITKQEFTHWFEALDADVDYMKEVHVVGVDDKLFQAVSRSIMPYSVHGRDVVTRVMLEVNDANGEGDFITRKEAANAVLSAVKEGYAKASYDIEDVVDIEFCYLMQAAHCVSSHI